MLRVVCFAILIGVCLAGGYGYYKPKPKPKCYQCEYSPPKMTTKTVFKTETSEMKTPVTKVHCWYSFEVEGKGYGAENGAQADCSYHMPTCKKMTTYKTVTKTKKVPMQVKELTPAGGFEGCKGPINHYNEKKLGVDAWECYSNCFIRKDAHGRITRGCFTNESNIDPHKTGCHLQNGQWYCFCKGDRCNGGSLMDSSD